MVLVITYITVLTNMTMQANFSGINSLTSFMYHWDLFSKVIIIRLDYLILEQSTCIIGNIHEIWQPGIK
jgi:hypothetical protein